MKKRRKQNKKDKITKAAAVMYFVKIFVSKIGQANFSIVKTGETVFPSVSVPVLLPPPQLLQGENKILLKL